MVGVGPQFSEKGFYLEEFRGRSLGFVFDASSGVVPGSSVAERSALTSVFDSLRAQGTRVVLLGDGAEPLTAMAAGGVVEAEGTGWVGRAWRASRLGAVGLQLPREALPEEVARVALRLRLAKLVWLHPRGGLTRDDGSRLSFVSQEELAKRIALPHAEPLESQWLSAIREMLLGGLPSVNRCSVDGLEQELFTYGGSGTFFTREQYTDVRRLALEEFDAAADLVHRGEQEGFLVPRSPEALEGVLANAFGVFVEGRFMAGLGALLPHPEDGAGEIASLYTLTRFVGEGVGAQLVRFALEEAARQGLSRVFACTTSERVAGFFESHGFASVAPEQLPASKWESYDPERRARLRCLVRSTARA